MKFFSISYRMCFTPTFLLLFICSLNTYAQEYVNFKTEDLLSMSEKTNRYLPIGKANLALKAYETHFENKSIDPENFSFDKINRYKWEKRMASLGVALLVASAGSYIIYDTKYEAYKQSNPQLESDYEELKKWQKASIIMLYSGAALNTAALVLWRIKWKKLNPYGMRESEDAVRLVGVRAVGHYGLGSGFQVALGWEF